MFVELVSLRRNKVGSVISTLLNGRKIQNYCHRDRGACAVKYRASECLSKN